MQIFPTHARAMSRTNHYLSPEELLPLCYCLKLNVVIFQFDEVQNTLAYLDHAISNTDTENIYISINVVAGRTAQRTHFERLEQLESLLSPQSLAVGNNSREQGSSIEEKELDGLPPPSPHSAKRPRMNPTEAISQAGFSSEDKGMAGKGEAVPPPPCPHPAKRPYSKRDGSFLEAGASIDILAQMFDPMSDADYQSDPMSEAESRKEDDVSGSEDVFKIRAREVNVCTPSYRNCFLFRWHEAIEELSSHLRENVLLPRWSPDGVGDEVFEDVDSGMNLPIWHCAFKDCMAHALAHHSEAKS